MKLLSAVKSNARVKFTQTTQLSHLPSYCNLASFADSRQSKVQE